MVSFAVKFTYLICSTVSDANLVLVGSRSTVVQDGSGDTELLQPPGAGTSMGIKRRPGRPRKDAFSVLNRSLYHMQKVKRKRLGYNIVSDVIIRNVTSDVM